MITGATFWIATAIKVFAIVFGLVNLGALLLWVERRQSALIQDRMGPNRANIKIFGKEFRVAGLLHSAADGLKMLWKEDFVPPGADKLLYQFAPVISLVPPLTLFAVIPFGPSIYPDNLRRVFGSEGWNAAAGYIPLHISVADSGILVVFAMASSGVLGAALAGSSSDNKYSLLGGLRAASQMVSYEVTMGFSLVGTFMVYQTLRLEQMVQWQVDHAWGIFVQPLSFLLFFTAAVAETKRVPFDAPEGESEIVAGYFTEYQPMKMGMFALGELVEVMTSSALITTIFLGGWQFPFLKLDGFHFELFGIAKPIYMSHLAVVIISALSFVAKVAILVLLQMQIRWTLPRFRYDQIMKLGWRILLPASLINILLTGVVLLFVNGR
jgi:NADH-quinone oxidoreductase subunit H